MNFGLACSVFYSCKQMKEGLCCEFPDLGMLDFGTKSSIIPNKIIMSHSLNDGM